jgi:Flp pilus assembly protein TadG
MPRAFKPTHTSAPRRARGQSIVEFGLIATLFLGLVFGIFDMGMMFSGWISVGSAASVAARQAAVGNMTQILPTVQNTAMVAGVAPTDLKVAVTITHGGTSQTYCSAATSTWTSAPSGLTCSGFLSAMPSPAIDDALTVLVDADKYQIVTPPMRLAFGCTDGSKACYFPLMSSTTVRYEGNYIS